MSVKKRILEFIKYKDITTKEFELSIGAGNSYVNNIRISIGDDKLELSPEQRMLSNWFHTFQL